MNKLARKKTLAYFAAALVMKKNICNRYSSSSLMQ